MFNQIVLANYVYQFKLGTKRRCSSVLNKSNQSILAFEFKPKINLDDGVTYVFGKECKKGAKQCYTNADPPVYDVE
jgi:hypothetical protein